MPGRRSATITTAGISSAWRSRTMNSSSSRADERRADAFQSMERKWSPGLYGRELAASARPPRRMLVAPPEVVPTSRRRG
jgi:hypothetical protein